MKHPTPQPQRLAESWLHYQSLRNYAPFLSQEWRELERWLQAVRTGREPAHCTPAQAQRN